MIVLLSAAIATAASGRDRIAKPGPDLRRILVIIAHPDDETIIAPFLGTMCVERGSQCSFLVMTRGEGGSCSLPGGCTDLGTIREQEMRSAATLFRASLTIWNLPDVFGEVTAVWSAASGGRDALVSRIRNVIEIERPTTIITFDPAHGTTQHPAHSAIGAIVLEVADPERVLLMETGATIENGAYRFFDARPGVSRAFDVPGAWSYLISNASIHASQFDENLLRSLAATPMEQRRVWLATAAQAFPR